MKKTVKRLFASLMVVVMMITAAPLSGFELSVDVKAKSLSDYSIGDIVEFGSYPQSKVTDSALISALDSVPKLWISYGYYSGTGECDDGQMKPGDWMKYADVTHKGERYRAVKFTEYRPYITGYITSAGYNTYQDDNGYYINTVYWFKFEPLEWRVLDPDEGFMVCESIIDSQPYNNTIYYYSGEHYQDISKTNYANDYATSSIRDWLNNDFYHIAFKSSEKSSIKTTACDNSSCYDSMYDSATTYDKIFLLSYWDMLNTKYGFNSSRLVNDTVRRAQGTDYAKCQGLYLQDYAVSSNSGSSAWWLRTPGRPSHGVYGVGHSGSIGYFGNNVIGIHGIRPALKFNPKSTIDQSKVKTGKLAFPTKDAWSDNCDYTYTYSDDFFSYDSSKYHHDLALMSMCLEASACVPDGGWKKDASGVMVRSGDDYSGKYPANAETLLNNIGFETWKHYGYNVQPGYDTVACTIASKNISENDTVIAVAVRGQGYEAEWAGNFNIGTDTVSHVGFEKAKKGVLGYIEEFVSENKDDFEKNVKFWITGYSRGAATANLVAAELNKGILDNYEKTKALGATKESIYCYTFETPQNTTDKNANTTAYSNIFSVVNPIDPVTKVAPSSDGFGFKRYGVTYYLPAAETVSNYNCKNGIKSQMNEVHKNIYGSNYKESFVFSEINYNLLGGVFSGFSIKENKSIGQMTFVNNLIDIIAREGIKTRANFYLNYQSAVQDLAAMFMGGYNTPDTDVLIEEVTNVLENYFKEGLSGLYYGVTHQIESLKSELATVFSENTEVSYDDAYNLLGQVDDLLITVVKHPNYTLSAINNSAQLFYSHYYHVLVGWMAYLETVPENVRNELLSTSLKYRTVKVNCPVDVNVYDSEGNLVASIIDDEVISIDGEYLSTYLDENGQKCIVMPFDEEYRIEVTASEDCDVSCSITEIDGETLKDEKVVNYYEMQVSKDETITCTAENKEEVEDCQYPITEENGNVVSPNEIMMDAEIKAFNVTVQSNIEGINTIGGGEYNKGEFAQVIAVSVENYVFDGWYSGGTLITKESNYRFCVKENINLVAVYTEETIDPAIKGKVNSVSINDTSMSYKDSATITPSINADSGVKYTVTYSSSNIDVVLVDANGRLTTNGTGDATITVTVTDEYGNTVTDTCNVNVSYKWWQWIIVIVLFGWIWY